MGRALIYDWEQDQNSDAFAADAAPAPAFRPPELKRLDLREGEILVVRFPSNWDAKQIEGALGQLKQAVGEGQQIIATTDQIELGTIAPA